MISLYNQETILLTLLTATFNSFDEQAKITAQNLQRTEEIFEESNETFQATVSIVEESQKALDELHQKLTNGTNNDTKKNLFSLEDLYQMNIKKD